MKGAPGLERMQECFNKTPMEPVISLHDLFRTALADGAVGFTLQTGLPAVTYSAKRVPVYQTKPSSSEEIEAVLRGLMTSREIRQLRTTGSVHFKANYDGTIPVLCGVKAKGDEIRVEMRKLA